MAPTEVTVSPVTAVCEDGASFVPSVIAGSTILRSGRSGPPVNTTDLEPVRREGTLSCVEICGARIRNLSGRPKCQACGETDA
jgi:hypothetical protein